jgi:hypothetical protein
MISLDLHDVKAIKLGKVQHFPAGNTPAFDARRITITLANGERVYIECFLAQK